MRIIVYDTESNGLLDEATCIHCAVVRSNDKVFTYDPDSIPRFISCLADYSDDGIIVCHNQVGHDLPLLEKLYGYVHKGKILDTLVLSRLLNPERQGRHSIEAWGNRFGVPKPEHEDWSTYSPEMLHRCKEDTKINQMVLNYLLQEADIDEEELVSLPSY